MSFLNHLSKWKIEGNYIKGNEVEEDLDLREHDFYDDENIQNQNKEENVVDKQTSTLLGDNIGSAPPENDHSLENEQSINNDDDEMNTRIELPAVENIDLEKDTGEKSDSSQSQVLEERVVELDGLAPVFTGKKAEGLKQQVSMFVTKSKK